MREGELDLLLYSLNQYSYRTFHYLHVGDGWTGNVSNDFPQCIMLTVIWTTQSMGLGLDRGIHSYRKKGVHM